MRIGQRVVAAVVGAVALGGVTVVGLGQGNSAGNVRLLAGSAWFASAKVGQLTLLDGASAEVAAQVRVSSPGNALEVVQQGATAYAVDQTAGTVRRVDGATFDSTPPAAPIADAHGPGLSVAAGPTALYTLDTGRGLLADTDPKTLDRRGELMSVASRLAAGTVAVDDTGTLWAVDTTDGNLTRVAGSDKTIRQNVVKPGTGTVTIANGHPVVVDMTDRRALSIDRDNGRTVSTTDLDVRTDDKAQVSGSPHADRIYVVAARGVLSVCDTTESRCSAAIPLTAGSDYGAAVEAGGRLFVPDYTTGQVWIVDLHDNRVLARPTVLHPNVHFELRTRDGVVFYNDAKSDQAGVIQLDGSVRQITKYDANNPDKGLVDHTGQEPSGSRQPGTPTGNPGPRPPTTGGGTNVPVDTNKPGTNQPTHPQGPGGPSQPNELRPLSLAVTVDTASPVAGQPVKLHVDDGSGTKPRDVAWSFGDGQNGEGQDVVHKWDHARVAPYIVTAEATMPDGRTGKATVNITVGEVPKYALTVTTPTGGTVDGGDIHCPSTCTADLAENVVVTLTATPGTGYSLGSWGGACSGNAAKCDVRMGTGPVKVTYTFTRNPDPTYTLTATKSDRGSIKGGPIDCGYTCVAANRPKDSVIRLTATPDFSSTEEFDGWDGACAGVSGPTCDVKMTKDQQVSASYRKKPTARVNVKVIQHGFVNGESARSCSSDRTCPFDIPIGDEIGWAPTPDIDSTFDHWGGVCAGFTRDQACRFTVNGPVTVEAYFKNSH